jgi:dihydropteroate synthase
MGALVQAGLPEDRIVVDPGIGFGKRLEHNLALLGSMGRFSVLGRPVYLGLSNKSLWEALLGLPKQDREFATQIGTALAARDGVRIHRVHNVRRTRQTLDIVHAVSQGSPPDPVS